MYDDMPAKRHVHTISKNNGMNLKLYVTSKHPTITTLEYSLYWSIYKDFRK